MSAIRRARHAVGVVFFVIGTMIGVWASRIPDIKIILGVDESGFGMVLLVMASGAFISLPVTGRMVDVWGGARMAKVAVAVTLALFASLAFGTSVVVIAPLAFLFGFSMGCLDVSMNAWGVEVEQALGRPVMSSYHGLYSLGAGVGAGVGAVALKLDLTVPQHFLGWSVLLLAVVLWVHRTPWVSERAAKGSEKAPLFAIPRGALFFAGIMALVAALAEGAITDWAALYQIQELGFDSSTAAVGFAVFSVAMVVMRLSGDQLIARFGPVPVARISGLAAVSGAALLVMGGPVWVIWTACLIMGLGNAVIFPLAMSRAAAEPGTSKGAALASVATLGYGAFLFGPPVLGFIGHALSLRTSFLVVALLALLIPLLAGTLKVTREA
ncbi:MFS transporter [Pannonibacter phragmitetus]|uniref:Major facilitator superfamily (MFS) profile domain-containing protein n=1 Tax=Pannonibacter phragmitetus TaxID=121719 RepID=A0A0U3E6F0_9HYPH|nr:MFS transporter [Pannonibacter phragmitetus]ALV27169.1 hypothetical protein APZ00_08945 [Pannonibacter phragmitetus]